MQLLEKNEFLNQFNLITESRAIKLTEEEFNKIYNENCKEYIKICSEKKFNKIYRGSSHKYPTPCILNPAERKSAYADSNVYNLFFSNDIHWKDFPKRNLSVIATLSTSIANSYSKYDKSNVYELIPYDNTKIGICSSDDIWNSFGEIEPTEIQDIIFNASQNIGMDEIITLDNDYSKLKDFFNRCDKTKQKFKELDPIKDKEKINSYKQDLVNFLIKNWYNTDNDIESVIGELYDPYKNGFKLIEYTYDNWINLQLDDNEVWFENKALIK